MKRTPEQSAKHKVYMRERYQRMKAEGRIKPVSEEKRAYLRDYYAANRTEMRVKQRAYNLENQAVLRDSQKEYYENNKEFCLEKMRGFQAKNPGYRKAYNDGYYAQNRAGFIQRARQRDRHVSENATPKWASKAAINSFYETAAGLSMVLGEWYEVDHQVPLKHPKVCGLHVEHNLRVITRAENRRKRNKFQINLG